MIDPVYSALLRLALAGILLSGAYDKWRERELFAAAMQGYDLIPDVAVPSASTAFIVAEALAGVAMLMLAWLPLGSMPGGVVLLIATGAVVINLLRGRTEISCGCGGSSADQQISWALVARNLVLLAMLLLATLPVTARSWLALDYVSSGLGALMFLGAYAAFNQLLANHPRLQALRHL